MDYTSNLSYLNPNKFFLSIIGLWPHQPAREKRLYFLVAIFFVITQGSFQIAGLIAAWQDTDIFLESIPPVIIDFICYVKLINFIYNAKKLKKLLSLIESDWARFEGREEMRILRDFGHNCRKKTLMYAGAVYGTMAPFVLAPLVANAFIYFSSDNTTASNDTIVRPLMFHVEYLVNVEKWYYYILVHEYFATMVYITIVVAVDTMLLTYVEHACSLFAIVGYRLEHLVDSDDMDIDISPPINEDKSYQNIIGCISEHSMIIDYVNLVEDTNSMSLFLQLGMNILCITFTGFQAIKKLNYPEESIRYASFAIAQIFPIFFANYPSHCLLTESIRIFEYFTRAAWYLTSLRTRKLFNLMILRSTRLCYLTAGNFYLLDMQFFAAIMRMSMSYLTMLLSFS